MRFSTGLGPQLTHQKNVLRAAPPLQGTPLLRPMPNWRDLIERDLRATIETSEVDDLDAPDVAALCLELAEAHPKAVEWVMHFQPHVRQQACELLKKGAQCGAVRCMPAQQEALAWCILHGANKIDLPRGALLPTIAAKLETFDQEDAVYQNKKTAKHGGPAPFLYTNPRKYGPED